MGSTNKQIAEKVQSLLIRHFDIRVDCFDFEQPLEVLQKDFKLLDALVLLEQLIKKEFKKDIPLLEQINTAFHTPKDIVELIMKEL